MRLNREKTVVTRGGKPLLARPPLPQMAASFSHADRSIRTTAQGAMMLTMAPVAGPSCLDTYHRTWLVKAWWARLSLLALHSFPARNSSLPLCKKEMVGWLWLLGLGPLHHLSVRCLRLQQQPEPAVLGPASTSPPACPISLLPSPSPSLHVHFGRPSLPWVQGTPDRWMRG